MREAPSGAVVPFVAPSFTSGTIVNAGESSSLTVSDIPCHPGDIVLCGLGPFIGSFPSGLVLGNGYVPIDNVVVVSLTNVTALPITLPNDLLVSVMVLPKD